MSFATTREAVSVLDKLYATGFSDPITDAILQKAVDSQTSRDRLVLRDVERDLTEMERQYQMPSASFYERWQVGDFEDTADFMDWSGLYRMAERSKERLRLMTEGNGS